MLVKFNPMIPEKTLTFADFFEGIEVQNDCLFDSHEGFLDGTSICGSPKFFTKRSPPPAFFLEFQRHCNITGVSHFSPVEYIHYNK